jgi:hypothetical protein
VLLFWRLTNGTKISDVQWVRCYFELLFLGGDSKKVPEKIKSVRFVSGSLLRITFLCEKRMDRESPNVLCIFWLLSFGFGLNPYRTRTSSVLWGRGSGPCRPAAWSCGLLRTIRRDVPPPSSMFRHYCVVSDCRRPQSSNRQMDTVVRTSDLMFTFYSEWLSVFVFFCSPPHTHTHTRSSRLARNVDGVKKSTKMGCFPMACCYSRV